MKSLNNRYTNVDNENMVFLTPNQVKDLDIGLDLNVFSPDELDTLFPFVVDVLKEMIKETTVGEQNGDFMSLPVENSGIKVQLLISINGKLCEIQSEEIVNGQVRLCEQVKLFQRLLSQGSITLEDLAAEDIDNDVYKKLVVNEIEGANLCKLKIEQIDSWVKEQKNNPFMAKRKENVLKNL